MDKGKTIPKYAFVVFYSEEDGCWVADVPDLRFCSAFGNTPEEAVKEIQTGIKGWVEASRGMQRADPPVIFNPAHLNFENTNNPVNE